MSTHLITHDDRASRLGLPELHRVAFFAALFAIVSTPIVVQAQSSSDMEIMQAYQNTLRRISRETLPVVVEVDVVERVTGVERGAPSRLDFFFGRPGSGGTEREPREREFEQRGIGSGIIVRRTGSTVYVLTNDHVAGDADEIEVTLYDGREFVAELVGSDANKDLALLSFETSDEIPVARLGDSDSVRVGDFVLAVGNPLGFESTVTSGIVSAVERQGPQRNSIPLFDRLYTDGRGD